MIGSKDVIFTMLGVVLACGELRPYFGLVIEVEHCCMCCVLYARSSTGGLSASSDLDMCYVS